MAPESTLPDFAEIARARELLRQYLSPSRLVPAPSLTRTDGARILLKVESDLPTGSFKVRGALYALWSRLQHDRVSEVVAASTGNHGAAVAFAASLLGIRATIFLPTGPNPVKRQRIAGLGAQIVETGRDISDAAVAAAERARQPGVFFLNDATDRALPAGPAAMACEIVEQCPDVSEIYVPVGDSALIRGIASAARALRPGIRIVGVQAERAPAYYLSWRARRAVSTDTCDTIADGLATRSPVEANVRAMVEALADMHLVSERQILSAIAHLAIHEHVVAEPAGAATTAALMKEAGSGRGTIVLIVSGANIAPQVLRQALCDASPAAAGTSS